MEILFKSEKTGRIYKSKEEAEAAEKEYDAKQAEIKKLKEERAARAKEVDDLYAAYIEAGKKYEDAKNAFIKDYKSYHVTYTSKGLAPSRSLIDEIFADFLKMPW